MSSASIVAVDFLSPKGHINFNSRVLQLLRPNYSLHDKRQCRKLVYCAAHEFETDDSWDFRRITWMREDLGRFYSFFFSLRFLWQVLRSKKKTRVVVLSYDFQHILLFIIFHLLGLDFSTFEHNTIPDSKTLRGRILLFSHWLARGSFLRLTLTRSAKAIFDTLGARCVYTGHPVHSLIVCGNLGGQNGQSDFFVPSSSYQFDLLERAANSSPTARFLVKGRSDALLLPPNVKVVGRVPYDEYLNLFSVCRYVFLPLNFEARASGPFFDALSCSKVVGVCACGFSHEMAEIFGGRHETIHGVSAIWFRPENYSKYLKHYEYSVTAALNGVFYDKAYI